MSRVTVSLSRFLVLLFCLIGANASARAEVLKNVAYGSDSEQRMDVYLPSPRPTSAPLIVMVHGGAWVAGDKSMQRMYENKAKRWVPKGFIFVSVNNRLVPDADPIEQADDVARALAAIQRDARSWGGDPTRLILMGHSAGGHLVALLGANPARASRFGVQPWLGTIALDSGAYDVPKIMRQKHLRLYDRAFGSDSAYWRRASPTYVLTAQATPLLTVCSSRRDDSCPQAQEFADTAKRLGVRVEQLAEDLTHRQINETLGEESDYTRAVESYMTSLDATVARLLR